MAKRFQGLTVLCSFGTNDLIVKQGEKFFSAIQFVGGPIAVLGIILLYFFAPIEHSFYPRCLLHSLTGLSCPGCGSLRALHALLHGQLSEALQLNGMLIASLPLLAWLAVGFRTDKWKEWIKNKPFRIWAGVYLASWIAFGIARNIPS